MHIDEYHNWWQFLWGKWCDNEFWIFGFPLNSVDTAAIFPFFLMSLESSEHVSCVTDLQVMKSPVAVCLNMSQLERGTFSISDLRCLRLHFKCRSQVFFFQFRFSSFDFDEFLLLSPLWRPSGKRLQKAMENQHFIMGKSPINCYFQ